MNFFNRAIKNVTRRLSKTMLLTIAFFMIGNFVIVGLGVANATENAKTLTRQKMRAVVTFRTDYDAIYRYIDTLTDEDEINEFYQHYPQATLSDVQALLEDERVKAANALTNTQFYQSDGLDFVHLNNQAEQDQNYGGGVEYLEDGTQLVWIPPMFSAKANFFPNMIEFIDGGYTITDGRFYTEEEIANSENVCLISNALAQQNGLHVGDSVTVYTNSPTEITRPDSYYANMGLTLEDITLELEIIGLYEPGWHITPDMSQFDWTSPYENPDNMFLLPASTVYKAQLTMNQKSFDYYASQNPEDEYYSDPANRPEMEKIADIPVYDTTLLLDDPLNVDSFIEDHKGGLRQFLTLDANNEEFKRLSKPLDTLNLYANFIVWLVVINAVVIITLVTALTLKTREYEIGVLLSIGASKFKVVMQFFVELAIVAILGFSLSIISGSLIASKVGQTVLEYQIQESEVGDEEYYPGNDYISIWDNNYTTDVTLDDLVSEYNVSVSPLIIGEIYVLGLGIVLVSILIPSMMIMRFNPKKILMNQN
ncbi:MAG: ABC transporter permease [Erysipelotrichaceae bacterium]|nr:ABC transporter permease [Erysipelotrichaceae bacterium]